MPVTEIYNNNSKLVTYFHLSGLLFERSLICLKLLGNLWTRLSGQDVFQFHVELLFLLNQQLLLDHLLRLADESLLEHLHLLYHLILARIAALYSK